MDNIQSITRPGSAGWPTESTRTTSAPTLAEAGVAKVGVAVAEAGGTETGKETGPATTASVIGIEIE